MVAFWDSQHGGQIQNGRRDLFVKNNLTLFFRYLVAELTLASGEVTFFYFLKMNL